MWRAQRETGVPAVRGEHWRGHGVKPSLDLRQVLQPISRRGPVHPTLHSAARFEDLVAAGATGEPYAYGTIFDG